MHRTYFDFRFPGYSLGKIINSKYVDIVVCEAIKRGARQVVLVGSGYDTRSLRLATNGVCFYELDSFNLLTMKAKRLQALDMDFFSSRQPPVLVTVDIQSTIETGKIGLALKRRGFKINVPSIIVMEEITQYTPKNCVVEVLNFTRCLKHVIVVITYIEANVFVEPEKIRGSFNVKKLLEETGQIISGYNPAEMGNFMSQFGLSTEDDFSSEENRRLIVSRSAKRTSSMRLERVCCASKGSLRRSAER